MPGNYSWMSCAAQGVKEFDDDGDLDDDDERYQSWKGYVVKHNYVN